MLREYARVLLAGGILIVRKLNMVLLAFFFCAHTCACIYQNIAYICMYIYTCAYTNKYACTYAYTSLKQKRVLQRCAPHSANRSQQ